jgi:hypothetical protein
MTALKKMTPITKWEIILRPKYKLSKPDSGYCPN